MIGILMTRERTKGCVSAGNKRLSSLTHDYRQPVNTAATTFPPYPPAHSGCGPYRPSFLCSLGAYILTHI
jgi:hypothetical protein